MKHKRALPLPVRLTHFGKLCHARLLSEQIGKLSDRASKTGSPGRAEHHPHTPRLGVRSRSGHSQESTSDAHVGATVGQRVSASPSLRYEGEGRRVLISRCFLLPLLGTTRGAMHQVVEAGFARSLGLCDGVSGTGNWHLHETHWQLAANDCAPGPRSAGWLGGAAFRFLRGREPGLGRLLRGPVSRWPARTGT